MRIAAMVLALVAVVACRRAAEEKPRPDIAQAKTNVAPKEDAPIPAPPEETSKPKAPPACGWLDRMGATDQDPGPLHTAGWKDLGLAWACSSDFWRLPDGAGANNLSYYVNGKADRATVVRLTLNVNDRARAASALKTLSDAAELLAKQAGKTMPENVRLAVSQGRAITAAPYMVTHYDWPSPKKGYEVEFLLKLE